MRERGHLVSLAKRWGASRRREGESLLERERRTRVVHEGVGSIRMLLHQVR